MPTIRPSRPADRDALYDVCVRTADAGSDATGLACDDRLWGDVWAVPYAERDPGLCWVVESGDGRVIGYIVATDDTDAFEEWFRDEWWPDRAERYAVPEPTERHRSVVSVAAARAPGREPHASTHPAHLHIDLLPEAQGQGLGRRLIETLLAELRRRRIPAAHLGTGEDNRGAIAFYERLGFRRLPSSPGTGVSFGYELL
ncbi:GNAT family N-acetyltransferase [Microbacterium suaedae]|uniref:GNAT family N-acetyltransferase n=1 Tax=Microbacterium suaedae TaxID=2067813 RepID=UPI000DAC9C96|nr:GNAT family N-acetyltransferase [Microbacterium suaedae]